MPFKSPEQRTYMKKKLPTIYKKWVAKYGTKIKPSTKKK